jgi:CheY-like chemotaxis protein
LSIPGFSDDGDRICSEAGRLVRRAAAHEARLQGLVRAAETELREAETALARALVEVPAGSGKWERMCSARIDWLRDHTDSARQTCAGARELHIATRRLLRQPDDRSDDGDTPEFAGQAASVLVVDDVEDIRELIALVLRQAGFVVRTAVNGVDALIAAHEILPAVIVMDMTMPVLDGIEATRLIKATDATRKAKVIAYTASPSLPEGPTKRLFVAVVQKPSTPDAVLEVVQSVATL